jgi:hypothetical protein
MIYLNEIPELIEISEFIKTIPPAITINEFTYYDVDGDPRWIARYAPSSDQWAIEDNS